MFCRFTCASVKRTILQVQEVQVLQVVHKAHLEWPEKEDYPLTSLLYFQDLELLLVSAQVVELEDHHLQVTGLQRPLVLGEVTCPLTHSLTRVFRVCRVHSTKDI
jgi:hypothetical protein